MCSDCKGAADISGFSVWNRSQALTKALRLGVVNLAAAFAVIMALSASPAYAQQDGAAQAGGDLDEVLDPSAAFDQMPTSDLLDLYNDVGQILLKRKLLPAGWNPAQDYAEILVVKALRLEKGGKPGRAIGPGGVKFRIVGAHPVDVEGPVKLADLDPADFDRLAVVIFGDRFIIDRALIAPKDVVATKLSSGALSLTAEVLEHAGVEDVTAKVDRFTGDEF